MSNPNPFIALPDLKFGGNSAEFELFPDGSLCITVRDEDLEHIAASVFVDLDEAYTALAELKRRRGGPC